jgi:hypothetical protein
MRPNNVSPAGISALGFGETDARQQFEAALTAQLGREIALGDHRAQHERTHQLAELLGKLPADEARVMHGRLSSPAGAPLHDALAAQFQSRLTLGAQHELLKLLQGRFQSAVAGDTGPVAGGGRNMDRSISSAAARQWFRSQSAGSGACLPQYWGAANPSAAQKFVFDFLHGQGSAGLPQGKAIGLPAPVFGGGFVPESPLHTLLDAVLDGEGNLLGGLELPGPGVDVGGQTFFGARMSTSQGGDFDLFGLSMFGDLTADGNPAVGFGGNAGAVGASGSVTGLSGAGFRTGADISVQGGSLHIGLEWGAALGLGGDVKVGVDLNFDKLFHDVGRIGERFLNSLGRAAEHVAKYVEKGASALAQKIGRGATLVADRVGRGLSLMARKVENAAGHLFQTAGRGVQAIGNALKKLFGSL